MTDSIWFSVRIKGVCLLPVARVAVQGVLLRRFLQNLQQNPVDWFPVFTACGQGDTVGLAFETARQHLEPARKIQLHLVAQNRFIVHRGIGLAVGQCL